VIQPDELEVARAFERFLGQIVDTLNGANVPAQPERIGEIVVGVLYSKLLRLADTVLALCHGQHGDDVDPTLRTLLLAYANLKFVCVHDADAAGILFMRHLRFVRDQLRPQLLRPDVEGEAFPVVDPDVWAEGDADLVDQWSRIDAWAQREGVVAMEKHRPPGKDGKPRNPLAWSWTGMTDAELFRELGDQDALRYYQWFSNEVHGNVAGVGELFAQVNQGRIPLATPGAPATGPLVLAAKYVVLGTELYDRQLALGLAVAIERASDEFAAMLQRRRLTMTRPASEEGGRQS
jgi:Family of unknown function (DUF5677)